MKEQILQLRNEGKTYNQIQEILKCSKSTISYYCGNGQKEKVKSRTKKRRENIIISKLDRFKYRKLRTFKEQVRKFNKTNNEFKTRVDKNINVTFTINDILEKFGENTFCYLTGEKINLFEDTYSFDHILPHSRGGNNYLENLGITIKKVNQMKTDMTPDELIFMCKKILEFNGYEVNKKSV